MAFLSYLALVILGALSYVVSQDTLRKIIFTGIALLNYIVSFTWVFAFYNRLTHAGRVCSGDFLDEGDSTKGFLIMQGLFLKIMIVGLLALMCMAVCAVMITLMRSPRQRLEDDEETELASRMDAV